jgi:hypothetical protein
VRLGGAEVLVNDDRTRTFLAVSASAAPVGGGAHAGSTSGTVAAAANPLLRAIHAVSQAFQVHGLPAFYDYPRPHASVAWLLGDRAPELKAALLRPDVAAADAELQLCHWQVQVRAAWMRRVAPVKAGRRARATAPQAGLSWLCLMQVRSIVCRTGQRAFSVWAA